MALLRPTRRELIGGIPLLVGAAALPAPVLAAEKPLFSFFVIGDWGRNGRENQSEVAELMAAEVRETTRLGWPVPEFIVSTGDNFYMFGVSGIHDSKWKTSFSDVYNQQALAEIPWFAVLGNHDYGGDVEAQRTFSGDRRWNMPHPGHRTWPGTFSRGNADFFFIDTVAWIGKEGLPFYFLGSRLRGDDQKRQAEWLAGALDRSGSPFKFVFGHHGIYSVGPHGGAMQMKELDDLLRCYDVTAYVHGHDHCLYHISHSGMDYICSGGGSQIKADYHGGRDWGCVFDAFCDSKSDARYPRYDAFIPDAGFARFDVYPERVQFSFRRLHPPPEPARTWNLHPKARAGCVSRDARQT